MKFLCALILTCCMLTAQAQQTVPILSLHTSSQPQTRATEATIDLVVINPNTQPLTYNPPEELTGTLQSEQHNWVVSLRPAQPIVAMTIAAGQFVSIPYLLLLPSDARGSVMLEVSQVAALRAVVDISDAEARDELAMGSVGASLKQQEAEGPPVMARIERTFANRFGFHEPIYFLYGTEAPAAKFQFSFKYRLIGENSKFGDLIPPFRGFYFAYTQRSLWDVDADSSPFYDTSYMPELFFEWLAPDDKKNAGWFHWLGLQTGVRHESNGQAGTDSRSLNIAYLRAGMIFGSLNGWHAIAAPRIFSYLGTSKENADIARYRGYSELQLSLAKSDAFQLSVFSRVGTHGDKGSVQVDLTQPIRIPLINLETYLQLQYFDGYGESLRTYNQKSSVWRIGLAFVR
jgi:phospholipase A1